MDELIDILNAEGKPLGTRAMKSIAHRKGLFHATVHIWFYTKDGELLLQKRSATKDIHPGLWDVSVAGHIGAGESIIDAAIREVQEEIGLLITGKELNKVGVFKSIQKHSEQLIDCEFHHTFLSELKVSLKHLTKQESEVDDLKLIASLQFINELNNKELAKQYVPHSKKYFTEISKEINLLF
jgi:isopentenyldiphosphate isomerase